MMFLMYVSVLKRLRRSLAVVVLGTMSTLQMTHVRLFDGYLLSKEAQIEGNLQERNLQMTDEIQGSRLASTTELGSCLNDWRKIVRLKFGQLRHTKMLRLFYHLGWHSPTIFNCFCFQIARVAVTINKTPKKKQTEAVTRGMDEQ
ncbi:uncharacterized protein LOC111268397 isoform X2 [Varroa jacobsoni]|uniref:uncharacterized protein LOC111268397 isoform X2 n=1 Tax=Varroa jacobsoni TaxID=62625 RepID=UPI000BF7F811|nr:uncharacterized protein LOC111268397 isoform X2 [Varroa jacobsoni]